MADRRATDEEKTKFVDFAINQMSEDWMLSASEASANAGRLAVEGFQVKGNTVRKYAQEQGRALSRLGYDQQKVAGDRKAFYSRNMRAEQRAKILEVVDLELERIRKFALSPEMHTKDGLGVQLASRLQAIANAHGTVASHDRSDELHALRMGDIDPHNPKHSLEDWDGNPEKLPSDMEERIIDIDATRRASEGLRRSTSA